MLKYKLFDLRRGSLKLFINDLIFKVNTHGYVSEWQALQIYLGEKIDFCYNRKVVLHPSFLRILGVGTRGVVVDTGDWVQVWDLRKRDHLNSVAGQSWGKLLLVIERWVPRLSHSRSSRAFDTPGLKARPCLYHIRFFLRGSGCARIGMCCSSH